jgi:S-DNA-T family DNA segregation ATPase FtsK/SpoIIIE
MSFLVPSKHPRINEAVGLVFFTLTVLIFLSLISYHPSDPSLNSSRNLLTDHNVGNFIGKFGSTLSDLLLQLLGYPSFLLPVIFSILGWRWLKSQPIENPWIKSLGLVGLLASTCALAGLLFPNYLSVGWSLKAGGLLGDLLGDWMKSRFNLAGALILSLSFLLISLFVSTRFSFSALIAWFKNHFSFVLDWRERWVLHRKAKAKEKERARLEKKMKAEALARENAKMVIKQSVTELKEQGEASAKRVPKEPSPRSMDFADAEPVIHTKRVPIEKSPVIATGTKDFVFPSITLLRPSEGQQVINEKELRQRAIQLTEKCKEFDVHGQVMQIHPGPVVTTYEFKPEPGVKYSRITNLVDDLCLALKAESVRIDRLPGKSTVGVEVPNSFRETIYLREIIESVEFQNSHSKLTIALGKDIVGKITVADLAKMPHLLIAGQTGSGKSVAVNAMILSILYKATPEEVKFILVDPKRLELGLYEDIPHLLTPVVTEPKRASNALKWATNEMENRYKLLAAVGVRNIEQYNALVAKPKTLELFPVEEIERKPLPFIVIVIDELADLMMVASKDVEDSVMRLAQMARAVGIHLIVATQRPSVDILTGVIKANFPCRISFRVAQKVDSRTILDQMGAQQLLGKGDMLFIPPGSSKMVRVHAPFVSEDETSEIVKHLKAQGQPIYNQKVLEDSGEKEKQTAELDAEVDEMYEEAVRIVVEMGKASTSILQRRLRLGYGRAARLIDMMERDGIVGPADGSKPREILKRRDYYREIDEERGA